MLNLSWDVLGAYRISTSMCRIFTACFQRTMTKCIFPLQNKSSFFFVAFSAYALRSPQCGKSYFQASKTTEQKNIYFAKLIKFSLFLACGKATDIAHNIGWKFALPLHPSRYQMTRVSYAEFVWWLLAHKCSLCRSICGLVPFLHCSSVRPGSQLLISATLNFGLLKEMEAATWGWINALCVVEQ